VGFAQKRRERVTVPLCHCATVQRALSGVRVAGATVPLSHYPTIPLSLHALSRAEGGGWGAAVVLLLG